MARFVFLPSEKASRQGWYIQPQEVTAFGWDAAEGKVVVWVGAQRFMTGLHSGEVAALLGARVDDAVPLP